MIKAIRMIPYHIRQAFRGMFRHMGMTLSAIMAVIITLLLLAVFLCAAGNVSLFASNIEGGLQIHATLDHMEKALQSSPLPVNISDTDYWNGEGFSFAGSPNK